jgi:hypothetical protein
MTHYTVPGLAPICTEVMEPSATRMSNFSTEQCALVSIAISMKRIADALSEPNEYGEIGGAAIAGSIKRGLNDG